MLSADSNENIILKKIKILINKLNIPPPPAAARAAAPSRASAPFSGIIIIYFYKGILIRSLLIETPLTLEQQMKPQVDRLVCTF